MTDREIQAIREWVGQVQHDLAIDRTMQIKDGSFVVEVPDREDWKIGMDYIDALLAEVEKLTPARG